MFLSTYPTAPVNATEPAIDYSFAGMLGKFLRRCLLPLAFNWQIVIALIPGMAAREVAVATLGTVYSISASGGGEELYSKGLASTISQAWGCLQRSLFSHGIFCATMCVNLIVTKKRNQFLEVARYNVYLFNNSSLFSLFYSFNIAKYLLGLNIE